MRTKWIAVVVGISLVLGASAADAATPGPMKKGARGAVNTLTGWLEVPGQVVRTTEAEGSLAAVSTGLVRGLWAGARRTVVGLYELFTCVVPNYPRQQVRDPYAPIIEPEFIILRPDKS